MYMIKPTTWLMINCADHTNRYPTTTGVQAQFGGQLEVWAQLQSNVLQEILTYKSDDINGRLKAYSYKRKAKKPGVPESFRVLVKELQSLVQCP